MPNSRQEMLELQRRIQVLEGQVLALTARLNADTTAVEVADTASSAGVQRRLSAVDRKVDGLGAWLSDIARRLVSHQAQAIDTDERLAQFNARIDRELSRERGVVDGVRVRETQLARLTDALYKDGLAVASRLSAIEDALGVAPPAAPARRKKA